MQFRILHKKDLLIYSLNVNVCLQIKKESAVLLARFFLNCHRNQTNV